jgi:hypothetical protein
VALRSDGAVEEHTTTRLEIKLVDKTPARRDLLRYHGLLKESAPPPPPALLPANFFAAVILGDPSKLELPVRMPALGSAPSVIDGAPEDPPP